MPITRDDGDAPLERAEEREVREKEANREFTTPERARAIREAPGHAPGPPVDRRDEDPDWRSRAAGTSRPASPGPAAGVRGRDAAEEESLRRQAEAGLSDPEPDPDRRGPA